MHRPSDPDERPGTPIDPSSTADAAAGTPIGADRLRHLTWWSSVGPVYGAGAFLVFAIALTERVLPVALVAMAGAAGGALASGRLLERRLPGDARADAEDDKPPVALIAIAIAGGLATLAAAQWSETAMGAIVPGMAAGAVAVWVPHRRRGTVIGGGAAVTIAVAAAARYVAVGEVARSDVAAHGLLVLAVGGGLAVQVWFWELVHRMDRARRIEGELAVAEERLRFAADLHDIQGHHLQVIALESELAARLAESDPSAAAAQMASVKEHARAALADTREVVHGYRRASLGAELVNATRVLAAAGIDGRLDQDAQTAADHVTEPGRHLLGLVVREATTNLLRHSRAGQARIALVLGEGQTRLEIRNDGAAAAEDRPGSGLAALAERLDAAGGALEWAREGQWFTVTARVPLDGERNS